MFHAEPAGIRSWSSEPEVGDLLLLLLKFETSIAIICVICVLELLRSCVLLKVLKFVPQYLNNLDYCSGISLRLQYECAPSYCEKYRQLVGNAKGCYDACPNDTCSSNMRRAA